MPLHAQGSTIRARWELFTRGQLPFLVLLVLIAPLVVISEPDGAWTGPFVGGLVVAAMATVAAIVIPWETFRRQWIAVVPILDLVSSALLYETAYESLPASFLLSAFPILWLGYGFHRWGLPLAVAGAFLVSLFPLVWRGTVPDGAFEWGRALIIPLCAALTAVWLHFVSRALRARVSEVERVSSDLSESIEQLEDRKRLTSAIIDAIDVGVAFYDADGTMQHLNATGRELFRYAGKPESRADEAGLFVFGPDRVSPVPPEQQVSTRALGGEHITNEVEWIGQPGNQRAVLVSARGVTRDDGARLGTVVIVHDVTQLARAVQVREDFLLSVTHELRTPLTSIVGYVDLISDALDWKGAGVGREFEVITRNAELLLSRIDDLLRLPEGEVAIEPTTIDLSHLAERSIEDILPRAESSRVKVRADVTPPVVADVDEGRYRQVIDNLLSNAVKYTPPGGSVTVELREIDGVARLVVRDTGVGMTQEEVSQLFDPFFRARQARDGAAGGFGIGLSIAHGIVLAHDGTIDVESEPGVGTTVTVRLPANGGGPVG
ncbi:PAS domain-containing sensor histidine kinase [Labedella phragmitis]|uniref:histidine kinase n=1 Tax=Labedella phragmitis TaxID=2498849 RepID=A0A444PX68_9MICO|nr:PAS domain-containing sensor histidine kinase [Labedella phragmitis]RWZ52417.1 PAS domain-containing sensor histidine kinase [Labedella phragmitis]